MSAVDESSTKLPFRAAMEAGDHAAVVDAFAPDAVVYSPITARLTFRGRRQIGALYRVILDVFDDIHYTDQLLGGDSCALIARARVGGEDIELVEYMRFDEDRRVRELTAFFRPMPAIAAATRALGSGLGRRRSRGRAGLISLLARPLGFMIRTGDRIAVRLVEPTI
jgi:hypothetical protein